MNLLEENNCIEIRLIKTSMPIYRLFSSAIKMMSGFNWSNKSDEMKGILLFLCFSFYFGINNEATFIHAKKYVAEGEEVEMSAHFIRSESSSQ